MAVQRAQELEIVEYRATEKALADLSKRFKGVVYQVEDPKGMEAAKNAKAVLRECRIGLDQVRKEIKAPALRRCQLIDSEAKALTARIVELEDPIDAQIKVVTEREKREAAERERIAAEAEAARVAAQEAELEELRKFKLEQERKAELERAREEGKKEALSEAIVAATQSPITPAMPVLASAVGAEDLKTIHRDVVIRRGVAMLKDFAELYGAYDEFKGVTKAIRAFLVTR